MKTTKKSTSCFVMLLFICITGFGQYDIEWTKYLDGYRVNTILETSDSGYVIAASNYSESLGDYQAWLLKMNFLGDTIWSSYLGPGKAQVASQTLDNGYIAGTGSYGLVKTNNTGDTLWTKDSLTIFGMTFEPSFSDFILPTYDSGFVTHVIDNSNQMFEIHHFIKLDKDGNVLIRLPGYTIPASDSGYIAKVGLYSDTSEFIKMNNQFDTIWQKKFPCEINYFFEDLDGGIIATGYSTTTGNDEDILLLKLDASGSYVWSKTYDFDGYDESYSVRPTIGGGYVICGYTESNDGSSDYFGLIIKTDLDGDTIWTKTDTVNKHSWSVYCSQTFDNCIVAATKTGSYETYFEKISYNNYEIKHIDTTICIGETYFAENEYQTESGIYYDTIQNYHGSDSIITVTNLQFISCTSEIPNGNFELWTLYDKNGSLYYDLDDGWYTSNHLLATNCVVIAEPEFYSYPCGDFAVKIQNKYTPTDTFPGVLLRFQGYGDLFPVNKRHSSINYYAAYFPKNGDSAYIGALMYKNNAVIGMSEYLIGDAIEEWTAISQDIIYFDTITIPDSMGLGFFAYKYIDGQPYHPLGESELYIDNVQLDTFIIDCPSSFKHAFSLSIDSVSALTGPASYVLINQSKDLITEIEYLAEISDTVFQVGGRQLCLSHPYPKHEVYMPNIVETGDTVRNMIDNTYAVVSNLHTVRVPAGDYDAYSFDFYNVDDDSYEETWIMAADVGRIAGAINYAGDTINYVLDSLVFTGGTGLFPLSIGNKYYYSIGEPELIGGSADVLEKNEMINIAVFPNPFRNVIELSNQDNPIDNIGVQLISIDGKIIHDTQFNSHCRIETTDLQPGLYLLRLNTKERTRTIKMLKMHLH